MTIDYVHEIIIKQPGLEVYPHPSNLPGTILVPTNLNRPLDSNYSLASVSVTDDSSSGTLTITSTNGLIVCTSSEATVTGSGTTTVVITGTISSINSTLGTGYITPVSIGNDVISFSYTDNGSLTSTNSFTITFADYTTILDSDAYVTDLVYLPAFNIWVLSYWTYISTVYTAYLVTLIPSEDNSYVTPGTPISLGTYVGASLYVTTNGNMIARAHTVGGYNDYLILYTVVNSALVSKATSTLRAISGGQASTGSSAAWIPSSVQSTLVAAFVTSSNSHSYCVYNINDVSWTISTGLVKSITTTTYNRKPSVSYDSIQGKLLFSISNTTGNNILYTGTVLATTCTLTQTPSVTIPPCFQIEFDPNVGKFYYMTTSNQGYIVTISGSDAVVGNYNTTSRIVNSQATIRYNTVYSKIEIGYTLTNGFAVCKVDLSGTTPLYLDEQTVILESSTTYATVLSVTSNGILVAYNPSVAVAGGHIKSKILSI